MIVPTFEEVMCLTRTVSSHAAFEDEECKAYYELLVGLPDGATVVEIGLQYGRSSSIVAQVGKVKGFNYIGIDPFEDPPDALPKWIETMQGVGMPFALLCMKSALAARFVGEDEYIDLLLIDGDHSMPGVVSDCMAYLPAHPGAIVCAHDYGRGSLPEVTQVMNQYMRPERWERLGVWGTLGAWRRR